MADKKKLEGNFALDLRKMIDKAKLAPQLVAQKASMDVLASVIEMTPVGNPSLWKVNKTAVQYNNAVSEWNASLRENPDNVDKRGRLKRGKKLNDGMDLVAPDGYVGGRLKANWFVSVGVPTKAKTDAIDKDGAATLNRGQGVIMSADLSKAAVYIVNNLPYAIPIEYGHSGQAPQGMVRVTVSRWNEHVAKAVGEVKNEQP